MAEKSEFYETSESKKAVLTAMVSILKEKVNRDRKKETAVIENGQSLFSRGLQSMIFGVYDEDEKEALKVRTKEELEKAVNDNAKKIIITGNLATEIIKAQKKKVAAKKVGIGGAVVAGLSIVGGIVLAPFTGGASAVAGVTSALTITVGGTTIALTTVEVIAGLVGVLGALGIAGGVINIIVKNYAVDVSVGSTKVVLNRK